ncbi:ExbD/TolR family protein [Haliangium ochraceum]|uniref:Biopolymer transport protein ExbD/TolR n=1 Tax=Haliangium ochraceum (strain DSM 14365 / JCM 11303 / SMP-2) TaxID=502025 RepID=D0LWG2_HALO1|nr:biopolymer transporter ExbD [Haliangium ochraceum]ACY17612.1 Biopolymer transport protein ExbD/TolR [Haliangium ochraceum DSM 14365]
MSGPDDILGRRRHAPQIQLSALIDVLFIVFVFVILVARFQDPALGALEVALPRSAAPAELDDSSAAVLEVARDGAVQLDGEAVPARQLDAALRRARGRSDALVLAADGELPLERATELIAAATRAGFASVSIATRSRQAPQ